MNGRTEPDGEAEDRTQPEDQDDEKLDIIEPQSIISSLPFELLASILAQIAIESPRTFVRTILVGRQFWIPHDSALLWEPICRQVYPELESGELNSDDYGGFYNLFRQRPTIRYNGVYICVSRYFRDGDTYEGVISFSKPRHEVRYYRYLWLREDGSVSSLLCNYPPKHALGLDGTVNNSVTRDTMHGSWQLNPTSKELKIVVDGGTRRKHDFHFLMEVASSGGKVHNKLKWRNYWCEEHGSGSLAEFSLDNEGSYYFCKLAN